MLLYQSMIPCSRQGDDLRRAVMTHELRSLFGSNHSTLFDAKSAEDDADATVKKYEWSGQDLLRVARDVVVKRSSKEILVGGKMVECSHFTRILLFLLDCVDDVLPACKVSCISVILHFRSSNASLVYEFVCELTNEETSVE